MSTIYLTVMTLILSGIQRVQRSRPGRWAHRRSRRWTAEDGQATAEYALVLLGAAAVALLLAAWAAKSGMVTKLLDTVINKLIGKAK